MFRQDSRRWDRVTVLKERMQLEERGPGWSPGSGTVSSRGASSKGKGLVQEVGKRRPVPPSSQREEDVSRKKEIPVR